MSTLFQAGQNPLKGTVPLTPIRRMLSKFKLGGTILSLGKRNREPPNITPGTDGKPPERARVALQKDDDPFDAIVITTLPCYPFCCHEDLIMMSRPQLLEVAATLNAHLPGVLQVEVSDALSDAHIRHSIETLLGIVPDTPAAPKAVRSWLTKGLQVQRPYEGRGEAETGPSPPSSPLAMRISRRRGFSLVRTPPRHLGRLDEEDEESDLSIERPLKRRKVSAANATPTRFTYDRMETNASLGSGSDVFSSHVNRGGNMFTFAFSKTSPCSPAKSGGLTVDMGELSLGTSALRAGPAPIRQM